MSTTIATRKTRKKNKKNVIFKLRKDNNLSQADMAKKLRTSQSHISKIESGFFKPDVAMLTIMRKKFNLDINNLLDKGMF